MENENNLEENTVVENTTTNNNEVYGNIVIEDTNNITTLDTIHTDLSTIICFLIFGVLVILLIYAYKFFDMFFKI